MCNSVSKRLRRATQFTFFLKALVGLVPLVLEESQRRFHEEYHKKWKRS